MTDADILFEFYSENFSTLLTYTEYPPDDKDRYNVFVYQKYTLISKKPVMDNYMIFMSRHTSYGTLIFGVYTYTSYTQSYKLVSKITQRRAAALLLRESY